MKSFTVLATGALLCVLFFVGCGSSNPVGTQIVEVQKDTVPFPPQGVYSITGDGQTLVCWLPNWESQLGEKDLAGYVVYRSLNETSNYEKIGTVGSETTSFADTTAQNGTTYFYAVSAFDQANNESDLSDESVFNTPRPAGSVTLQDYNIASAVSGFSFIHSRVQLWNNNTTDIYFGVDTEVLVPYIYSDSGSMQDMGWTDSFDEISYSPEQGFTTLFVEAIIGHTYVFLTPEGHYAKIRITDLRIDWGGDTVQQASIEFDWAYQLQAGNPELAPKLTKR